MGNFNKETKNTLFVLFLLTLLIVMGTSCAPKQAKAFDQGRKPTFNRLYPETWQTDKTKGRASLINWDERSDI